MKTSEILRKKLGTISETVKEVNVTPFVSVGYNLSFLLLYDRWCSVLCVRTGARRGQSN